MYTLDEVRKAYEDLSDEDKKTFYQSLSDRVHESIAAQEREKGEEDTQSAEDREHEALGAEHADEREEEREEEREDESECDSELLDRMKRMEDKISALYDRFEKRDREAKPATDAQKEKLNKYKSIFD